jgi:hypothetical protein
MTGHHVVRLTLVDRTVTYNLAGQVGWMKVWDGHSNFLLAQMPSNGLVSYDYGSPTDGGYCGWSQVDVRVGAAPDPAHSTLVATGYFDLVCTTPTPTGSPAGTPTPSASPTCSGLVHPGGSCSPLPIITPSATLTLAPSASPAPVAHLTPHPTPAATTATATATASPSVPTLPTTGIDAAGGAVLALALIATGIVALTVKRVRR